MKKTGIIVIALLVVILGGMRIVIGLGDTTKVMAKDKLTVVETPDQKEAMENDAFKEEEYVPPVIEGENVALKAKIKSNAFNDVYEPANAADGDRGTYWEGSPDESVDVLTAELAEEATIHTIVIGLNPAAIWSKRTQEISFEVSNDGTNYTEIVAKKNFDFDPKTGNQIVVEVDEVTAKYVRASISANTGAVGGQVAEFEIYAK